MKDPNWDPVQFDELRERVRGQGALEAFDALVEQSLKLADYRCRPGHHGFMKDYRYFDLASGEQPFAFTANQEHLLFYIRPAGLKRVQGGKEALIRAVGPVEEGANGEWKVRISTLSEGQALASLLFGERP